MKKICFLFSIFLVFNVALAQQEISTAFTTQMNTTFGNLDKNRIPHGILLDYGMEFTNVPRYNGMLTDSTFTNKTAMSQIYKTLLTRRIRDVSAGFVTPLEYETRWRNNRSTSYVAIGGLFFRYVQVADNAVTTNKITVTNAKAYDKFIGGVWQNPYQEFETFVMTPEVQKYEGLSMQVRIPSTLFYSNYQSTVQSIQIDFGNGVGYTTVPFNQNIAVNYTTEGVKIWKYKLNLSNGTALYNQSRIKVAQGLNTAPYSSSTIIGRTSSAAAAATLYSQTITGTKLHLGATATVKLTIDLAAGHLQITKPLIVAEGFDLGVVFSPENANGMNTYDQFRKSLINSGPELRNLIFENNKQYDIIYVDWNNGIDFMQRNAYALEEVIKWVNAVKVGTEKNVVLGQSMGGVIARYALADMEQDMQQTGVDHKTRLFISHDAPQQGANIPVSLQYMYRHLTNQYIRSPALLAGGEILVPLFSDSQAVSTYLSILDAPASKQLLSNFSNLDYGIDNSVHTTFYNELKAKGLPNSGGYPINCRNIAISNGAECGLGQEFNPGDNIVNYNWNKGLTFGGDLLSMIYLSLGGVIGGQILDNDFFGVAVTGLIPGKSKYNVEFNAKAMPYGTSNQIYKDRISYSKRILWIGPTIVVNITNVQKSQPAGILPLDTYGGGFYDTSIVSQSLTLPSLYVRDKFNFIPTTSALDIGNRNITLQDVDYKSSYVGAIPPVAPKNSPFANFSTDFDVSNPNSNNQSHISFNARNGEWFARELNGNAITTNCSFICSGTSGSQISGNETLCASGVYSVPSGATTYTWSITENAYLATLSGNGLSTITLTNNNVGSGYVTLLVTYGNTICGNIAIPKRIWVGAPQITGLICPSDSTICGGTFCQQGLGLPAFSLTNSVVANSNGLTTAQIFDKTNWEWERVNTNIVIAGDIRGDQIYIAPNFVGQTGVRVRAKNNCSWSEWSELYFEVVDCGVGLSRLSEQEKVFIVYPNPSNDIVNIDVKEGKTMLTVHSKVSAELFDIMCNSKAKINIKNNKASFNVSTLNKGIYVLQIYIDGKTESHQIGVK